MKNRPNIRSNEDYLMMFWVLEVWLYVWVCRQRSFKFLRVCGDF